MMGFIYDELSYSCSIQMQTLKVILKRRNIYFVLIALQWTLYNIVLDGCLLHYLKRRVTEPIRLAQTRISLVPDSDFA